MNLNPNYITDSQGNKLSVILNIEEYQALIEQLEDFDDIVAYELAKKEDDGHYISLENYLKTTK